MSSAIERDGFPGTPQQRFSELPQQGFVRAWQFLGCRKRGIAPLLPISRSTWYAGIAAGRWHPGVHLGPRTRAWPATYIRSLLESFENGAQLADSGR